MFRTIAIAAVAAQLVACTYGQEPITDSTNFNVSDPELAEYTMHAVEQLAPLVPHYVRVNESRKAVNQWTISLSGPIEYDNGDVLCETADAATDWETLTIKICKTRDPRYRAFLVAHEVGHVFGLPHAEKGPMSQNDHIKWVNYSEEDKEIVRSFYPDFHPSK